MKLKPYLALEASAGSGKTFALSVRYLSLLFMGANPHKIVALTFTNKSAAEMRTRIFETLKDLEHKDELEKICLQTGKTKEAILHEKSRIMKTLLQAEIKIATLDSFFALILRHFSLNIGLQPDFKVGQKNNNDRLIEHFIKGCQRKNLYHTLISLSLNEDKKLRDIFSLLHMLYQKKSQIDMSLVSKSTYPSLLPCLNILKTIYEKFEEKGLSARALKTLQASTLQELLAKKYLERDDFGYWDYQKYTDETLDELLVALKHALNAHINAKEAYFLGVLGELFKIYNESLNTLIKEQGELAFDDVTNLLYHLLHHEISKDFLYFRLDGMIEHLLIDEFQDTSIVQYEILLPMIEEIRAGKGVRDFQTLFFVGDVKQSIYRFRGGAKELFDYAKKSLHLAVDALDTNYRSTGLIVEFINEVFGDKIKGYEFQYPHNEIAAGYVCVQMQESIEPLVINAVDILLKKGIKPKDIALLVHTNKDAKLFQEILQAHFSQIHIRLEATLRLVDVPIIQAIIFFLKYLYFGDDLYKAQFLVLCDKPWDTPLSRQGWDIGATPLVLVEKVVKTYQLFDGKMDILSLLEIASRYEDIESFLFALEELSDEAKSEDIDGLRVLTVHKSKGLEFEHVILCDRLGRENHVMDTLLFGYDDIHLKEVYWTMSGREIVDNAYAKAKEKEQKLLAEDKLNALYVAFTRAKRSLFICAKTQHSAFDILSLKTMEKGEISLSSPKKALEYTPIPCYQPKRYGAQQVLTTHDENNHHDIASITFGIAQHYFLEMLSAFNEEALKIAYIALVNRFSSLLDEKALQTIYQHGEALIASESFVSLIQGATTVRKEQPVMYQQEQKQIDLLLEYPDKIVILDYKSSKKDHEKHHAQITLYQEALSHIYTLPIEGYICYLHNTGVELVKNL